MNRSRSVAAVASFWSSRAKRFDAIYDYATWWDRWLHQPIQRRHDAAMDAVLSLSLPTVCDIGCGSGRQLAGAIEAGAARAVGVDVSSEMVALARRRSRDVGCTGRVEVHVADALGWETHETFDLVWALGVFDYVRDPQPLLRRMRELSRNQVLATFRRMWAVRSPFRKLVYACRGQPIYLFTKGRIRDEMSAAGFRRVSVERLSAGLYIARGSVGLGAEGQPR
jgi:SAM-dependent methyltransferase